MILLSHVTLIEVAGWYAAGGQTDREGPSQLQSHASAGMSRRLARLELGTTVLPHDLSSMVASDFLRDGSDLCEPEFQRRRQRPNAFLTQPGKSHSVTSIIISYLKQSPTSLDSRGEEVEHNSRGEGFQRICGHLLKHPCLVPACVGKGTLIIALQEGLLSAQAPSWVLEDKGNHMVWGQQREHLLKVTWQREKK